MFGMFNGSQIRKLRIARGLTQGQLAEKASLSRLTVMEAEAGKSRDCRIGTVKALAKVLDVPWVVLLSEGGER
jgi:transcriptional regulator with XRE-family HTH domain